ncbi:MAG: PAS domain S-box protein [Azoarcus sp.]|nr:PAS domain S-box protein [Azoarcus sp.]
MTATDNPNQQPGVASPSDRSDGPPLRDPLTNTALRIVTIAMAYAALAVIGRLLALGPGHISPIWPAAGLALVALLVCGRRCWPGVWLGAFASFPDFEPGASWLLLSSAIATGATLQALLGATLVRKLFGGPAPLTRERDLLRFLLRAGPVACLISASLGVLAMALVESVDADAIPGYWLVWWTGDVLGVVLFAPLFLLLFSPTRRRLWPGHTARVITPLMIAAVLLATGNVVLDRLEQTRERIAVEQVMDEVHETHFDAFQDAITIMRGMQRLFTSRAEITRSGFLADAIHLMRSPGVIAVEWLERVHVDDLNRFEAEVRQETGDPFTVFDPSGVVSRSGAASGEYFIIRYSEPRALNGKMAGLIVSAREELRAALEIATMSGSVTATEPITLYRTKRPAAFVIVPIYTRGFEPKAASPIALRAELKGYVRGVFDLDQMFFGLARTASEKGLLYRIADVSDPTAPILIESTMPADAASAWTREIAFGQRTWRLQMQSATQYWHPGATTDTRLLLALSILTALAAAFSALGSAGRNVATDVEVAERTGALEDELAARQAAENALRENERDLAITLASIGDAVIATDYRLRVQRMNAVAERLTAWPLGQAIGRPVDEVFSLIDPHSREPIASPALDVSSTLRPHKTSDEVLLLASDGLEHPVAHSAAPILDERGAFEGVVLIFRDTREERAARDALAASERRYRRFVEVSPYAVFVQCDGRFVFVNPKAVEIFGAASEHELLGRSILDLVHPDARTIIAERIGHLKSEGAVAPAIELQWLRIDGYPFLGESTGVPYEHEGQPGALVLLQDITARRNAEAERDRFFDLAIDLLCVIGEDGHFLRINPAFTQVLGWSKQELLARPSMDFVHPDDRDESVRALACLNEGYTVHAFENRFACKHGGWRRLSWNALPQPDGKIFASAHDVTEQHEAAQQLKALNTELERSLVERTAAVEEAELASQVKSAFLATMSHEIRTPMNGIVGMAEILHNSQLSAHQLEQVTTIQTSANALLRIIDDLLDFSKIEAGRLELERNPVSLTDLVEGLCRSLSPVCAKRNVDLMFFVSPRIPERVLADDVRLRQLLNNLLGNAIKFSAGQRGRVRLRVEPVDEEARRFRMQVSDNGIGIAADAFDGLFIPFSQAEVSTTRRFGGTGLGLAICKRLMDLMGGDIEVASEVGKGSTFTVTLPLELASEQPERMRPDLNGVHCITVAGQLLDERDLREYLESAGARVSHAASVAAAARLAKAEAGEVVVLRDIGNTRPATPAAFKGIEGVRHVLIARGRRDRARQVIEDAVLVDGNALRRDALLRAVAVATGRASPEMFIESVERELIGADTRTPSVEEARAQGRLILVAEDDEINRKVISQQLSLLGHACEIASDGLEAFALWRAGGHALLLTDMHMPNLDGYTLARTIREQEDCQHRLPILALTANAIRGEAARAHEAGIDAYLTKPIQLTVLRSELEKWLPSDSDDSQDADSPTASEPSDGPSVLDLSALEAVVGDDDAIKRQFLGNYLTSAESLSAELTTAIEDMDFDAIVRITHRLKSSSRSMGAMALGAVCACLEEAARDREQSRITADWPRFAEIWTEARAAIRDFLSSS